MGDWIKVGSRYINLDNVSEVHVRERPRSAQLFFVGGGVVELATDDTDVLLSILEPRAIIPEEVHRTVIQLSHPE
jgi:hypothetical protein